VRWPEPEREVHVWRAAPAPGRLEAVLGAYLGIAPDEVRLGRGPHGKPQLEGAPTLRFNLSHAGEHWLLAVATGREVGVDVEALRPRGDVRELAEVGLPAADSARVAAAPAADRGAVFHRLWVRHEARLKCHGVGLVAPVPVGATEVVVDLSLGPGVVAAVAAAGGGPVSVQWTGERQLRIEGKHGRGRRPARPHNFHLEAAQGTLREETRPRAE
jgi:4'-phosphopantetheinyl transferase superfamily